MHLSAVCLYFIFHIVVWIGLRLTLYLRLVVLSNFLLFPEPLAASLSVTFLSVYMCDTHALKERSVEFIN